MNELMKLLGMMNNKYFIYDNDHFFIELKKTGDLLKAYISKYGKTLARYGIIPQTYVNKLDIGKILDFYCNLPQQAKFELRYSISKDFNPDGLRYYYVQYICNSLKNKDMQRTNTLIESSKQLSIFKSVSLNTSNNQVTFTLPNDESFTVWIIQSDLIKGAVEHRCFDVVNKYIHSKEKKDAVCGMIQTSIFGTKVTHVSMIDNGYIEDYTHGIKMKLNEYWKAFHFEALFIEPKEDVLDNIKRLNYQDSAFKSYEENDVCKYFTKKHMDKYGAN